MPLVSGARLVTPEFARVWLATFGAFMTFGMLVLALPLYVKDELDYGSVGVGLAVGAASMTAIVFSTARRAARGPLRPAAAVPRGAGP